jgi:hypothetical protein
MIEWKISEYIASVCEDSKAKCTESCWIIGEQGDRERTINGRELIWLWYKTTFVKYHGTTPFVRFINMNLKIEGQEGKTGSVQGWIPSVCVAKHRKWRKENIYFFNM